ncbi:MAG: hypothetical protein JO250_06740 [Armatimonadetes bacterium]|nr:hypothetical protein [Armatimonadota bacterium]
MSSKPRKAPPAAESPADEETVLPARPRAWRITPEAEPLSEAAQALQQLARTAYEFERAVWNGHAVPPDLSPPDRDA